MKKILEIISYLALVLIVLAPVLFYSQAIDLAMNKLLMTSATVVWFATAIFWMGREKES